ncbi:MAG: methyltransferase domain-containing protein [Pseudomonadota bacterium]
MTTLTRHRPLTGLYDAAAATWQAGVDRLGYPAAYKALFATLDGDAAETVLDAGTGSGAFAAAYLDAHPAPKSLTLLDTSAAMLTEAESRLAHRAAGIRTVHAGIGTDVLDRGAFDMILAAHVIEHLDDAGTALAWLHQHLAPGGRLVLAVSRPHWCTALLRWKWGHKAYRPHTVQELLERAGFVGICHVPFPSGPPARTSAGYTARRPH